jgi:hypothetical protein
MMRDMNASLALSPPILPTPDQPVTVTESAPVTHAGFDSPAAMLNLVLEAWGDVIDPRELMRNDPDEAFRGGVFVPDRRENRARGEDYPIFRNEYDLAHIRAVGDFFAKRSAGGVGPLGTLSNYVFGKGFTFTPQAAEGIAVDESILAAVQRVINGFVESNSFNGRLDRELDNRARRHGEALLVLKLASDGNIRASFTGPANLTEPTTNLRSLEEYAFHAAGRDCDECVSSWSFGIHTPDGRFDDAIGYHFVWNPQGTDWDYLPADRVLHVKRNVDLCVKRGVSDFYACEEFLLASEKLLRNTAAGSAVQAAIAYIVEHAAGVNKDAVEQQRLDKATRTATIQTGTTQRTSYQRQFLPGTVLDINKGKEYKAGPLGSERAPRFIEVIQAALRYVGTRWAMPEYMISGDASNANLASALVAEAPFVKAREADQLFYSLAFRELLWKVLRIAFDAGRIPGVASFRDLQAAIYLKIDPPAVATRDRQKEIAADAILVEKGAMAVATMAQRDGLDHKAEVDAGAKPAAPFMSPMLPATPQANGGLPPVSTGTRPTAESVDDVVRRTCTSFRDYP